VLKAEKSCKNKVTVSMRKPVMTPEQKAALQQHVDEIAKILYADCDPESLQTLADIETTVRDKMLEHVSPQVGFFYQQQNQNKRGKKTQTQK
jgi:hypothetical protein